MSVLGVLGHPDFQFRRGALKRLDFVVADQLQAFASVFGQVDDLFVSRQVLGELAVALVGAISSGVSSWPLRRRRRFCSASRIASSKALTTSGVGCFAKIQKQLAFAIDASFALAPVELLQQFFDR